LHYKKTYHVHFILTSFDTVHESKRGEGGGLFRVVVRDHLGFKKKTPKALLSAFFLYWLDYNFYDTVFINQKNHSL
jgi:hypothetical protein